MTIDQLRILVRVVQAGNFTRAAEVMGVRKSYVSRVIASLEAELGVKLIDRSTRANRLTDVGRQVYDRALAVEGAVEETRLIAQNAKGEPSGTLRLTAGVEFGQIAVNGWIADYLTRYAAMTVEVEYTSRVIDLVHEGFDLAIRIGALSESALIARRLGEIAYGLFACPRYLAARGTPRDPSDLAAHTLIQFTGGRHGSWHLDRGGEAAVTVDGPARLRANDSFAIRDMALASLGIGRLPLLLAVDWVEAGRLVPVLPDWSLPSAPVQAVYPENRYLSPKVRAFIDLALDAYPVRSAESRRRVAACFPKG